MKFRPKRFATDVFVTLKADTGTKRVQLRDISPRGARLRGPSLAPVGTRLMVEHLGTKYPARVCWDHDANHGVIFAAPLSQAKLAALRAVRAR